MDDAERKRRIEAKFREEVAAKDIGLWWLSFADPFKPKGFLGVVILEAYGPTDAMIRTRTMGLNPGGQIEAMRVYPEDYPDSVRNRLLSAEELKRLDLV